MICSFRSRTLNPNLVFHPRRIDILGIEDKKFVLSMRSFSISASMRSLYLRSATSFFTKPLVIPPDLRTSLSPKSSIHLRSIRHWKSISSFRSCLVYAGGGDGGFDLPIKPSRSFGEIHVIVGPMFAGKTTALLRRVQAEESKGRNVTVIKSDKDTRYGLDSIVTHDGAKLPCLALRELSTFKDKLGLDAYNELDVIGIDEAQFFEDLYDFCSKAADCDGKTVIVAGLDGDYLRRKFGWVLDIVPLADSVTKLTARCDLCGQPAYFTLRKTNETQTELIGGADVYMPVCRQHYVDGQAVVKASRIMLNAERSAMVGNLK